MDVITCILRKALHLTAAGLLLAAFFVSVYVSPVQAGVGGTFSWRANPVEDEIVGYRLYLGLESRYDADNQLKVNFSYEYYIDFTSWEYCPAGSDGYGCLPLPDNAVSCVDLFQDNPICTISDLQGYSYFTLTAYNALEESDYTQELTQMSAGNITPGQLGTLQMVYSLLLR